jgi:phenylacetate-CoA ligase
MRDRVAYHFRDKCVVLRGYTVPENRPYRYAFLGRWLILSSFHLDDETIPLYIKRIRTFNPKYIMAYPSSVIILGQYVKSRGINLKLNLKALLLGSEEVYPFQRQLLDEVFKTRVFSWYGQSEKVVLAGGCEESTHYHIFLEYSITEVVDERGEDVGYGKMGMIVGTSFINYAMPLIRYYTGDLAIISDKRCKCGREYPLMEQVIGRAQDFIVTKNGKLIPLTALIFGQHFKAFSRIRQMQIIQEKRGEIKIRIVRDSEYTVKDEEEIYNRIKSIMHEDLDIIFEYCENIPRTKMRKHRFLIQKLDSHQNFTGLFE